MKDIVVVKTGGKAASDAAAMAALFKEMQGLSAQYSFILVHGGGAELSRISKVFNLEPVFKDGVRLTTPPEMEIADMVLAGKMNKELVRLGNTAGCKAVGLSGCDGCIFTGKALSDASHTGKVTGVDAGLLTLLLDNGYLPVVSSVSMEAGGKALNINADEAALAVAQAMKARKLFFISDIPGVLKEGKVISLLTKAQSQAEIEGGVISGGMIPKVNSSITALEKGVKEISIGEYKVLGDLEKTIERRIGTSIVL